MTHKDSIVGVILAGGRGTRIKQLPTKLPKPALPILNKPIIYYQMNFMQKIGIKKVFIVVGHNSDYLIPLIKNIVDINIEIIFVEQHKTLGIAHSISILESHIDCSFLLFLGDIYFESKELENIVHSYVNEKDVHGLLMAKKEKNPEQIKRNYCIISDENGQVTRVIEKPKHPITNNKGVGIYLFENSFFDAVRRTPRTAIRDEYEITDSIQIYINDGYTVKLSVCIENDINITYPKDLWEINMNLLSLNEKENFVGRFNEFGENVSVKTSIIGHNCRIGSNSEIVNSIIFDNANISARSQIRNAIVCEEGIINIKMRSENQ